ncbi:hypothetical protein ACFSTA_13230 [Ornithinibacillus salinisoli]|uniref:ABC transporter periplasmic binding protein yphF n=1 Tax=Ornithinibacillus salinisoli TaxID=1848459 RepID=A0ABW4W6C2_9BACI
MKFTYLRISFLFVILILLSGCLYPNGELEKNQVPNEAQLNTIQHAIEQYQEQTNGLLPIKTKENDTPIFEKYLIDFSALKEQNIITEIPGNAYENGGVYQYAIINPEDDPQVKLIDLRITEEIRRINVQLDIYRDKHIYPPFGEEIADGFYSVNYKVLGYEEPLTISSPYSAENLPIIMDTDGKLYVDYRIELNNALNQYEHQYTDGDDIRFLLANNTPFVPAYSFPYTIRNGEPVFMQD